jgi:hypothetical protein
MHGTPEIAGVAEAGAEIDSKASMTPYSPTVVTAMMAGRVVRDIVSPSFCETLRPLNVSSGWIRSSYNPVVYQTDAK